LSDTAIILGAGFSKDAGIPLLANFVDKMWELSIRGSSKNKTFSATDQDLFKNAMKIRFELDSYHGRAQFDDRNIEDILSILSFDVLAGRRNGKRKFETMSEAIARTIELTCSTKHSGVKAMGNRPETSGEPIYREFWKHLFDDFERSNELPTLITLNYDLVLERSLLQLLIGLKYNRSERKFFPRAGIRFDYHLRNSKAFDFSLKHSTFQTDDFESKYGSTLEPITENADTNQLININYLKLHGSVNFENLDRSITCKYLHAAVDNPYILPPIFNKNSSKNSESIWSTALKKLRSAKNIVIIGYSLPKTDIYMQYFLKAALGPNSDLNRIFIFDPELFKESKRSEEMRTRYLDCFSPQLKDRITFQPSTESLKGGGILKGSAEHFVSMIGSSPSEILF
jgi:hypothetical protein